MNQIAKHTVNMFILLFGMILANPINQTDDHYNDDDDDGNSTRPHCCSKEEEAFLISTMSILVLSVFCFVACACYVCKSNKRGYKEIRNGNVQVPTIYG